MSVKAFKLITGEEVCADIDESVEGKITVKNGLMILPQKGENGPTIGFFPWMAYAHGPITVPSQNVVLIAEVDEGMKNSYNSIFGTGIVVPSQQLITG